MFAFGAILFEALCGFRAYDAPNFNALIVMIATTQPKKIDECAPKLPEKLRALVRNCMLTDKEKRTQKFDEVADALVAAVPDIESAGLALPSPARQIGEPLSDPDATNALPVVRGQQRERSPDRQAKAVPPLGSEPLAPVAQRRRATDVPLSGSGYSAPWATPSGAHAAAMPKPKLAYLAGAGLIGMLVAAMIVGVMRRASGDPHRVPASHGPIRTPPPPPNPRRPPRGAYRSSASTRSPSRRTLRARGASSSGPRRLVRDQHRRDEARADAAPCDRPDAGTARDPVRLAERKDEDRFDLHPRRGDGAPQVLARLKRTEGRA